MSRPTCPEPLAVEELVDYGLGELAAGRQDAVEAHLFACEACSLALEAVVRLGAGVAAAVREGRAAATVTGALIEHAIDRGARVREYRLTPGATVACTAGPDDTFVAIRLAGPPEGVATLSLDVEFHDLATGERHVRQVDDVSVDGVSREVVLLVPGEVVRAYPRSRWTMHARTGRGGETRLGPYTLDHTPWEQLTARA